MAKQVKKQKSMEEALWEWYHLLFGYEIDFTRGDTSLTISKYPVRYNLMITQRNHSQRR